MHVLQWCLFGETTTVNFSQRKMDEAGLCSRDTWEVYSGLLCGADVMVKRRGAGTFWNWYRGADGVLARWTRGHLRAMLKHGFLVLPYPTDDPPPLLLARSAPAHFAQRSAPTHWQGVTA
jgi:hypothetical protein